MIDTSWILSLSLSSLCRLFGFLRELLLLWIFLWLLLLFIELRVALFLLRAHLMTLLVGLFVLFLAVWLLTFCGCFLPKYFACNGTKIIMHILDIVRNETMILMSVWCLYYLHIMAVGEVSIWCCSTKDINFGR